MTKDEIREMVNRFLYGQGGQVDLDSKLPVILQGIMELIPAEEDYKALTIESESDTTIEGYSVPNLTEEQIVAAYNAVIAGKVVIIASSDTHSHFVVNQADSLNDEPSIEVIYYSTMLLTYTAGEGGVEITAAKFVFETEDDAE